MANWGGANWGAFTWGATAAFINYTVWVDLDRDGSGFESGDTITNYVMRMRWHNGMKETWEEVAPPARLELTLNNTGGEFNPENTGSAYYNKLAKGTLVRVDILHVTTPYTLFIGKIKEIVIEVGEDVQEKTATLIVEDQMAQLATAEYYPRLLTDATADEALTELFEDDSLIGAYPYYNAPALVATFTNFETGITVFNFLGDAGKHRAGSQALQFIKDTVAAEGGGRFWWEAREGKWKFHNRHHDILNATIAATFTAAQIQKPARYHASEVKNHVSIQYEPRILGDAGSVVWTCPTVPFKLAPGQRRVFRGPYINPEEDGNLVSTVDEIDPLVATTDYLGNSQEDGTGANRTSLLSVEGRFRAKTFVAIVENGGGVDVWVTHLQARGTPVLANKPDEVEAEDADSKDDYDVQELRLSIPAIDDGEFAQAYAGVLVERFKEPVPRFSFVTFTLNPEDPAFTTSVLARTIGDHVTLQDAALNHDADYVIVGEAHEVTLGSGAGIPAHHRVSWVLRPVERVQYWIWDDASVFDETTRFAF